MGIRLELCEAPLIAQTVDIGKHTRVGRPANVPQKSAWLERPSNYFSQFYKNPETNLTTSIAASHNFK